jgi:hypothetical protein
MQSNLQNRTINYYIQVLLPKAKLAKYFQSSSILWNHYNFIIITISSYLQITKIFLSYCAWKSVERGWKSELWYLVYSYKSSTQVQVWRTCTQNRCTRTHLYSELDQEYLRSHYKFGPLTFFLLCSHALIFQTMMVSSNQSNLLQFHIQ